MTSLPAEVQSKYFEATEDPWFTNAELWRHLKDVRYLPAAKEAIILQAHINQQCYADLTNAGQTAHDRSSQSLISFNLELKRRRPLGMEIEKHTRSARQSLRPSKELYMGLRPTHRNEN